MDLMCFRCDENIKEIENFKKHLNYVRYLGPSDN